MFGAGGAGAAVAYALMELGVGRLYARRQRRRQGADPRREHARACSAAAWRHLPDPAAAVRRGKRRRQHDARRHGQISRHALRHRRCLRRKNGSPTSSISPPRPSLLRKAAGHRLPHAARHRHGDLPGRARLRALHRPQGRPAARWPITSRRPHEHDGAQHCASNASPRPATGWARRRSGATRTERLWWIDIENPRLHSYDPATGAHETVALPGTFAGTQALTKAGDRLLAEDLTLYASRRRHRPPPRPLSLEHGLDNRLNDGRVDARGRFWVGTMDNGLSRPNGALYRVDADGTATRVESGVIVSNGIAFSPDGKTLYFTDTRRYTSYAYDLDLDDGRDHQSPHLCRLQRDRRPSGRRLRRRRRLPLGRFFRGRPHRALPPRRAHRPHDRAAGHQPDLPRLRRARPEDAFCDDGPEISGRRNSLPPNSSREALLAIEGAGQGLPEHRFGLMTNGGMT